MNTKVLLRRITLSIALALLVLFLILWQAEKSRIDTINTSMDTRISVVFASLCSDLSQDLGRYETDDWQRLHGYTFYLTNIDMVSFGAVPEEAEAREKLVFALDALLEPLEEKRTEFPEDLQGKLLYLSSRSQDVPLMEEILAELEALPADRKSVV